MLPFSLPIGIKDLVKFVGGFLGYPLAPITQAGVEAFDIVFPEVLSEDKSTDDIEGIMNSPGDFSVSGKVTDSSTGLPIPYCKVQWHNTHRDTVTSSSGYYSHVDDAETGYSGTLVFEAGGYETKQVTLDVMPDGKYVVDAALVSLPVADEDGPKVKYRINTNPSGALCYRWNTKTGTWINHGSSGNYYDLPVGRNYIHVSDSSWGSVYTSVSVPSTANATSPLINSPGIGNERIESMPPPPTGFIEVTSEPSGATAPQGFVGVGSITPFTAEVPIGTWRVFLEKSGYQSASQDVTVTKDAVTKAFITLSLAPVSGGDVTIFKEDDPISGWHFDSRETIAKLRPLFPVVAGLQGAELLTGVYRTFFKKDPITQDDITPDLQDYGLTALTFVGLGAAAGALVSGLAARAGAATVTEEMVNAGTFSRAVSLGSPLAGGIEQTFATLCKTFPARAGSTFFGISRSSGLSGFWKIFIPVMAIQQLDVIGWGFGWMPEPVHNRIDDVSKQINGGLIRLDGLIDEKKWDEAGDVVGSIRSNIKQMRSLIDSAPASFYEGYGFTLDDMRSIVDGFDTDLQAIIRAYPAIEASIRDLPDEITGVVTDVYDGDTIVVDDSYTVRFLGMDAHESGTAAGQTEAQDLTSLISGKTVTVKIDPNNQVDQYGRVLGLVFYNNQNITHYMLKKYGPSLLPSTTYQKRNKHVDWNENKLIAEQKEVPVSEPLPTTIPEDVGTLKLNSSPSNAKIYLDGQDTDRTTSETIDNLPARAWDVTLILPGYETMTFTATVKKGGITEVFKSLVKTPEAAKTAKPSRTTLENHFKSGIISEQDARDGLSDLGYEDPDIDTYIIEWIKELKLDQVGFIYKSGIASPIHVHDYLILIGYTDADIDGLFSRWDDEAAAEAQASSLGNIAVTSEPLYADIYLDGVFQNTVTPAILRGVAPGDHTVLCKAYQHQDTSQTVTAVAGQEVPVHLILPSTA